MGRSGGRVLWLRALVVGGLLSSLLGACAVTDPVDRRYDMIGRSLAQARDESIFLNLVRAGHNYPLAFTTISNVTPTMTNVTGFALPSFSIGPPNCLIAASSNGLTPKTCAYGTGALGAATGFGNTTFNNSTSVSSNFNISTEETGSFYNGFLKPIDLQTLDYFIRQEYPRELLFWLFADRFQVTVGKTNLGYEYAPPTTYGCPERDPKKMCFRDWIWVAVLSGLTVEERTIGMPAPSGGGSGGAGSSKPTPVTVARFCFSDVLARQAQVQMGRTLAQAISHRFHFAGPLSPICGTWSDREAEVTAALPQGDTFDFSVGSLKFSVVSRSAYGVFEFLGNIMRNDKEHLEPGSDAIVRPTFDGLPPETAIPPEILTASREPLFTVLYNQSAECFSHTWFYDGEYCVPQQATNTKLIFSLLSQLIAIETTAADLSITPIVRVLQ
jgi:hypothetical protein